MGAIGLILQRSLLSHLCVFTQSASTVDAQNALLLAVIVKAYIANEPSSSYLDYSYRFEILTNYRIVNSR